MSVEVMSSLKVVFDGTADASKRMKEAMNDLCQFGAERIFQLSQEYIADNSFDLGVLLQSGYVVKVENGWWRVGYNAPWGLWVEMGTRAPRRMPPIAPIKAWCMRHLKHKSPNMVIEPPTGASGRVPGGSGKGSGMATLRKFGQVAGKGMTVFGHIGGVYGDAAKALKKGQGGYKAMKGVYKTLRRIQKGHNRKKKQESKAQKKDRDAESMAWAVAKAIAKNGTEPRPFMRPALQIASIEMRGRAKLVTNAKFSEALKDGGVRK